MDIDEYNEECMKGLQESVNPVMTSIKLGIDNLENLCKQMSEECEKTLMDIRSDRDKINAFVAMIDKAQTSLKQNEAVVMRVKESNDKIIKNRIEYLEQQCQSVKDILEVLQSTGKAGISQDIINGIKKDLEGTFKENLELEKTKYVQKSNLRGIQKSLEHLTGMIQKTNIESDIMKDCLDAVIMNNSSPPPIIPAPPPIIPAPNNLQSFSEEDRRAQKETISRQLRKK